MKRCFRPALPAVILAATQHAAIANTTDNNANPPIQLQSIKVQAADAPVQSLHLDEPAAIGGRLGLTVRETPAAVEVMARDKLQERGLATPQEALDAATGLLSVGSPGNGGTALSSRGFSGHASVMQVYDGSKIFIGSGTLSFPADTWTLERIEILRGPGSVLYGEGSVGGVINYVPRALQREPRLDTMLAISSWDGYRFGIGAGQALSDNVVARADFTGAGGNGQVDRNDYERYSFSGAVAWELTERLTATLKYDSALRHDPTYYATPLVNGKIEESLRDENYNVRNAKIQYDDRLTRLRFDYAISEATQFSSETQYIDIEREWRNTENYTYNPDATVTRGSWLHIRHDQEQLGQRFDFSTHGELWGWSQQITVGAEFNRIRFQNSNRPSTGLPNNVVPAHDFDPGYFINSNPMRPSTRSETEQWAVSFEHRLDITERWKLVTGWRNEHIEVDRDAAFVEDFSYTSWRVGTVYDLTPDTTLYAQMSRGIDPINSMLSLSVAQKDFKLTPARQEEIGIKQRFAGGRAEWALALYHIQKRNLLVPDELDRTISHQVGQRSSRGVEITLGAALTEALRIDGNFSFIDAQYDKYYQGTGASRVSYNGNTPSGIPKKLANLWFNYRFNPQWDADLGARDVGSRYRNDANEGKVDSYTVGTAQLNWRPQPQRRFTLRVRNVTDELYARGTGTTQSALGTGRELELEWSERF